MATIEDRGGERLRYAGHHAGEDLSIGCEQGVTADHGSIHGLEDDYANFSIRGQRGDHDLWGQHLQNLIGIRLGDYAYSLGDWQFHKINGNDLARININPAKYPVYDHKGNTETFWRRTPTSTISITDAKERPRIIASRWGGTG